MANSKTVLLPIEISYKAPDDSTEVRNLTIALSLTLEEGSCGEVTINGAVMPVDDHPNVVEPGGVEIQAGDAMKEAA